MDPTTDGGGRVNGGGGGGGRWTGGGGTAHCGMTGSGVAMNTQFRPSPLADAFMAQGAASLYSWKPVGFILTSGSARYTLFQVARMPELDVYAMVVSNSMSAV